MKTIYIHKTSEGNEPYTNWLDSIRDKIIKARIRRRIDRLYDGNEGDHKSVGQGVFELRLSFGSGYRIYYGKQNEELIILLLGGDKSSQASDIKLAQQYWENFKRCNHV